ncbi:MAG: beta-galactosidase [Abditibacteriales bacterium]|nr:beta-galactosidase [Abditibacteriales bacterium]MDW8365787.1 beta-galactosidase [Abditibacteriales bacterium]
MKRPTTLFILIGLVGATSLWAANGRSASTRGPQGYGIFQHMHYTHQQKQPTVNIDHPLLAGVEVGFKWATLEPQEGQYNWQPIERILKPWSAAGKKVILMLKTVQKRGEDPDAQSATPRWVFNAGAKRIVDEGTNYPIYWDNIYLAKLGNFLRALAQRYDGHPDIEFIEAGLGAFGTTKLVGPKRLLDAYAAHGYTPQVWTETVIKILDLHRAAFSRTPIAVALSPFQREGDGSNAWVEKIARYAASKGIIVYHHGLMANERFVNKPYAKLFHELSRHTKTALGLDGPSVPKNKPKRRNFGAIGDIVRYAVGGTPEVPRTHISYMTFYVDDVTASNPNSPRARPDYVDAFKWLHGQLRRD